MALAVCNVPVTDLRREPVRARMGYEKDPLQESQILEGEKLIIHDRQGSWVYVEAIEQKKWIEGIGWKGYPGWVEESHLREVHGFEKKSTAIQENWREKILAYAPHFLGMPYLWGGRSLYNPQCSFPNTSVDCSGYTQLLYRSVGIEIPRDAVDQCRAGEQVSELEPADLVFLEDEKGRIYHVLLYVGEDLLYESTMISGNVRKITSEERFGVKLKNLDVKQQKIYPGISNSISAIHLRKLKTL